jgi:hypothetical protein
MSQETHEEYLDDDYGEREESDMDEEELYFHYNCHLDRNGYCGKAGSEECDFECPFSRMCRS